MRQLNKFRLSYRRAWKHGCAEGFLEKMGFEEGFEGSKRGGITQVF